MPRLSFVRTFAVGALTLTFAITGIGCAKVKLTNPNIKTVLSVLSVNPASGPITGGSTITISGTGFAQGATVTVGGLACGTVQVLSANALTCVTAANSVGTYSIVVTNPNGNSASLSLSYAYLGLVNPVSGITITSGGSMQNATGAGGQMMISIGQVGAKPAVISNPDAILLPGIQGTFY